MSSQRDPGLPDDLHPVEQRLRRGRIDADAVDLDRVKRQALAQFRAGGRKVGVLRARLAAVVTGVALLAGAGGAVALSGLDSHANVNGGAADKQYKHHHGCKGHHHPKGKKKCPPPKPKPKPKPKAQTGPAHHVTSHSAVITGTVNGHGVRTRYYFVWGVCGSTKHHGRMRHRTRTFTTSSKKGKPVSANLGHLKPGERYCYRVVATNKRGTTRGQIRSFQTQAASSSGHHKKHHKKAHGQQPSSHRPRRDKGFTG